MGSGIAQLAADAGLEVTLFDLSQAVIEAAKTKMEDRILRLVEKNSLSEQAGKSLLGRLTYTSQLETCRASLILEAIAEDMDSKTALFRQLDSFNSKETIFATNTSSLSVTAIAKSVPHPERVVGLHFFNPAPLMKLVELVLTSYTGEAVCREMLALAVRMGKTAVICQDSPGFIVNRVARPYYLEALRIAERGIADMQTIDRLMEATGFKMGPFKLMDLIGNDVNFSVSNALYQALGKPARLKPSVLQAELVKKGLLGRKTNAGYYMYP